jgi:AraC-like DNA-binding protein
MGLPASDRSIVTPNGCAKLIIPCDNAIESVADGRRQVSHEHQMYFVGNRDSSTRLRTSPRNTTFITMEFTPQGAFSIFGVPMSETCNRLCEADAVFGRWSRETCERIDALPSMPQKVAFIQDQLLGLPRVHERRNGTIDACVSAIRLADGRIAIRDLQRETGYSWRYIDRLFKEYVGLPPKVLAGIFRFQRFYRKWATTDSFDRLKEELYDFYYDQAHFSREFRRMTGHAPQQFVRHVPNEFGRRLLVRGTPSD